MARLAACILALLVCNPSPGAWAATPATFSEAELHNRQDHAGKPHGDSEGKQSKQPRDRWKWWLYDREELGITDKQSAEIDRIFEETVPGQRAKREEIERLEPVLAKLTKEATADVATIAQHVDRIETLRAEMNKTRTIMLYRMNLLLNPEQRAKVKALYDKRDAERRRNDSSRRR
jgi:Spy/CpxP family protein refolding chaperone